jgi:DNA repair ATPase RecN
MTYTINLETGRLELNNLSKEDYTNLESDKKDLVKRYFTFSRYTGCWVSKSTKNLTNAKWIAEDKLNMKLDCEKGEQLNEKEQLEIKLEKAKNKIEKYETYKLNATERMENYQEEFNKNREDIAYITQPNINSSSGKRFTNQRNKAIARYEKGFEELEKIKYYEDKIKTLNKTIKKLELKIQESS